MFRKFLPAMLPFVILGLALPAAQTASAATAVPIHFTAAVSPAQVHPGEVATVTIKATVDPDWHVYSVVPTPNGPATTYITSAGTWQALGGTTEDASTLTRTMDSNFGEMVGYHEHAATFSRQFRVPASSKSAPLSVTIHYQTCNHSICLPPTDATVSATPSIAAGAIRTAYANPIPTPTPPAIAPATATAATTPSPTSTPANSGIGLFLLAALGAGLLAIVTPCVFPLIPITLTSFVKQAEGDKGRLMRLSGGYAMGIVALYVGLGALVAATLHGQANTIAANPWVNLVEFVLFVVFAFSFFEVVELRLPAGGNLWKLQQAARGQGGTAGLALLGISFVLGSFTCTAPFVGTLLVSAASGQWARPLLGMLVFALAFASPFFVFAAFPQWIGRIPKGGIWLSRFKACLGFIELAAAMKFLSNADQVWQWKLLTQPVLLAAWAVIFFAATLYLTGTLRFGVVDALETSEERHQVPPSRRVVAMVFAIAGAYCFWGLTGRPISPYVGAFLPAPGYGGVAEAAGLNSLPWLSNYDDALAQAKAAHKPLLIDFTGYTCTNCRLNEKNVFPQPSVQNKLADFVRVQLYTDGSSKEDAANAKLQQTKFGDVALPLYGIVNPDNETVAAKTEGVQSVSGFNTFLTQGQHTAGGGAATASAASNAQPTWAPYGTAAVAQAQTAGKPVIVDFTAAWCVNCKAIEHNVFESPQVAPTLASNFVTLRSDMTKWTAPDNAALQKQYHLAALPTIIFLNPKTGQEITNLRITGQLPISDFENRMQQAEKG